MRDVLIADLRADLNLLVTASGATDSSRGVNVLDNVIDSAAQAAIESIGKSSSLSRSRVPRAVQRA
jgi:hypothetical protein